jgi:hypothetical protein
MAFHASILQDNCAPAEKPGRPDRQGAGGGIRPRGAGWQKTSQTKKGVPVILKLHSRSWMVERMLIRVCPKLFFGTAHHQ